MTTFGVASWVARFPEQVIVTAGGREYPLAVPLPREPNGMLSVRPQRAMLAGSGWSGVPGQEWEQNGGEWTLNVFAFTNQPTGII